MTPFDMQFSTVIYSERLQEATGSHHSGNTGIWAVRVLPDFSAALHTLAQKLGMQPQSNQTASTSHLS